MSFKINFEKLIYSKKWLFSCSWCRNPLQNQQHLGACGGRGGGGGGGRGSCLPLFLHSKKKKGNTGKKERVSSQKLLKGCHQGQKVTVLAILEHLGFKTILLRVPLPRSYYSASTASQEAFVTS